MNAFYKCTNLTSITIPNSVTSIGEYAFYNCTSLTSITIPNSVTSIGSSAFFGCTNLTSITIPDSITSIGNFAFYCCDSLTSITIPDSVTSIGARAFFYCTNLTSITIPNSVTSIGYGAFYGCDGLTTVNFTGTQEKWNAITVGENNDDLLDATIYFLQGETSSEPEYTGPKTINLIWEDNVYKVPAGVTVYVGDTLVFDNSVLLVDDDDPTNINSLKNCRLNVHFDADGDGTLNYVVYDSDGADEYDLALKQGKLIVTAPGDHYTQARIWGDGSWSLDQVFIQSFKAVATPESENTSSDDTSNPILEYLTYTIENGEATITDCNTSLSGNIIIPSKIEGYPVTSIGYNAFYNCDGLTSVTIPDSVTSIGSSAFYNTAYYNNTSNWENDVLYIGNHLIEANTSISGDYSIKEGTKVISGSAFEDCSNLTSITIPDSVTSIGYSAFEDCDGLKSITIPDSVTSIGSSAFYDCSSLTSITIPDSVTTIGNYAFYSCSKLTSVTIGNGVTSIGVCVFTGCSNLTSITIPDSVTSIGISAFEDCSSLTSVTIPDSVTSIGNWAFSDCDSLRSVTIGNGVTSIGSYAFNGCSSLASATIGNSVTSIGDWAFSSCSGLTSITIPDSVTSIGGGAFSSCSKLTSITIPDSVTSIGSHAFSSCSSLTSVTIPDSVTSIGSYAFYECYKLATAYYIGTSEEWAKVTKGSNALSGITVIPRVPSKPLAEYLTYTVENNEVTITGCSTSANGDVEIPSTIDGYPITFIGEEAFYKCTSLASITIPDSVTSIGTEIADDAFDGVSGNFVIKCYEDSPISVWAEENGVAYEIVPIPYGNVNADEATDIFDLIALAKHTVGNASAIDTRAANTSAPDKADRNIDIFDLIALAKHICNPEHVLGPKA